MSAYERREILGLTIQELGMVSLREFHLLGNRMDKLKLSKVDKNIPADNTCKSPASRRCFLPFSFGSFSFFDFHLQAIKTVKEKDVFFFFPWASNNIFLNFFQSSIDILFKDWWESICLLPKSACHGLFMKLSKFLVLCPNYGLVFYLLNVKSPKHNQFILLMVLWVKI